MKIANLTQHPATQEQKDQGVFDLPNDLLQHLRGALNFRELPDASYVRAKAMYIVNLLTDFLPQKPEAAMIGGANFLMAPLQKELLHHGIKVLYAFSVRESVETPQPDGSVVKVNVFKHRGFVETPLNN